MGDSKWQTNRIASFTIIEMKFDYFYVSERLLACFCNISCLIYKH